MNDNQYFKPTILYKEYMILDMVEKNPKITQREIATHLGVAVSMINDHLEEFERNGLIKRKKYSTKTVEYLITKKGSERRKVLNIGYLNATKELYFQAKENFEKFLVSVKQKGFTNILLYGAGEVAEMLLHSIMTSKTNQVNVLAVIDDDLDKIGTSIGKYAIIPREGIRDFEHDGILIATYTKKDLIKDKLLQIDYPIENIIEFFE
ncbi:winged helix-turn-helix transcriptional regulator [Acholeplasma vituli]|uniref:Winged helix-turn-helix transcriptional regulator n=1 Tax=Paracholeplasma vituli TaxID=69473 RepID=A0ABT2PT97_9MOLU|nr:winged helix-turn-helix transcriptional regulator [Paracholeplasma vituli]MCU0104174.1 winged helix-turn-helix transcriptional regulator [Paracholeplasma vituli]